MSATFIDIWINCPEQETAQRIADACVEARLVACANIMGAIASVYRWKGEVAHDGEVALALKTRASLFDAVCEKVRELHPYEVPSIIAMELPFVDAAYAEWLEAETRA